MSKDWFDWPALPDLFPVSFPGVKTSRDRFLVDTDPDRLKARIGDYFDKSLSHGEVAQRWPAAMKNLHGFNGQVVRDERLANELPAGKAGGPGKAGFIRYDYRPFDTRWLYWDPDRGLLDAPRVAYRPHVFEENVWIEAREREAKEDFSRGTLVRHLADNFGNGLSSFFPAYLRYDDKETRTTQRRSNLTIEAGNYLRYLGANVEDLFYHVLSVLHDPAYREANAGALRMEWPRIPLPGWPDGKAEGAADDLAQSAAWGRELARLLDPEAPVPGVTQGALRPETAAIAVPSTVDKHNMSGDDFALTAGWGHYGSGDAVMPGQGRIVEREYTADERGALGAAIPTLGATTFDIYLNERAFWRNVPAAIWGYKLGGYQVLKKWLSYRERDVLGRALLPEEVLYFSEIARRVEGVLMVTAFNSALRY